MDRRDVDDIISEIVRLRDLTREPIGTLVTQDRIDGYKAACEHILAFIDPYNYEQYFFRLDKTNEPDPLV